MKPGRQRANWILYQLRRKGTSGAEIARRVGVGRPFVSMVMVGTRKGLRVKGQQVKEEIAKALNKSVEKIFDEQAAAGKTETKNPKGGHVHGIEESQVL